MVKNEQAEEPPSNDIKIAIIHWLGFLRRLAGGVIHAPYGFGPSVCRRKHLRSNYSAYHIRLLQIHRGA